MQLFSVTLEYEAKNLDFSFYSAMRCNPPGEIRGGRVEGSEFTYRSRIHFRCNVGHKLIGYESLMCQENGEWNGAISSCERKLLRLPVANLNAIDNMHVLQVISSGFIMWSCAKLISNLLIQVM